MSRRQDEFEQIALPHMRGLLRFARRLTGSGGVAEDLVQETLLLAWRGFHQLQPETNARAWLYRIMMNAWCGWGRRARRMPGPELLVGSASGDTHEALEIRQALDRLPSDQRNAITLAVVEGFTCREIAGILEVPLGTVMSRLGRARQSLRESLREPEAVTAAGKKQ